MRILLVSPMLPEIGGISIASERLRSRLIQDGHTADVFSMSFKTPSLNNRWLRLFRFLLFPLFILTRPKYDIIHCHVSGVFRRKYIASFKKHLFRGAKLIFTMHGNVTQDLYSNLDKAMSKSDAVICVQPGDAARISQRFGIDAVDIPAFIMPTDVFEDDVPADVLAFAKSGNSPLMIATGGVVLIPEYYDLYGLIDTVELFQTLRACGHDLRLLLVVTGNVMTSEQKEIIILLQNKLKGDDNALLVCGQQMPLVPLFKYAKLFLRPTKTDGDALSVREALATKCSVLASDVAVRPKGCITYHGKNEMTKLAQSIIQGDLISEFSTEDFYHQIVNVYERVGKKD